ncbi:MAG: glycoside hydrolase family 2 TIM barrel-domain containing protein [Cyclobacteriaceae bacterium]
MKNLLLTYLLLLSAIFVQAQTGKVTVQRDADGMTLMVNGKPLMINGMNWDYFPIGTNYSYSLWNQPDDIIKAALDAEMSLLRNMGVNAIRQYTGVQPKWIQYIYENYGIYTMLNHSFGRYGLTIDGAWVAVTDYRDEKTKKLLLDEATEMAEMYRDTPGLLLFLLGNENNYGLFWAGAETEDFPDDEEEKMFIGEKRGRPMYKLMNDAAIQMKALDKSHPVAICNGDLLFSQIIAEECKDVDILGVNMYRGASFTDAFERVKNELDMPIMFTEFGADAYNAVSNSEDQKMQAFFMVENWKEIYQNAAGMGKAGNSLGGFTFQFSDGWWKFGQTKNLDVHDNNASWANGGYYLDHEEGANNMNEEWFGICAKGQTDARGLYQLYPRAAYYALKELHSVDPLAPGVTQETLENHFAEIELMDAVVMARGDKAALAGEKGGKLRLSEFRANISTYQTGGNLITTPDDPDPTNPVYPDQLGFDNMESYFIGFEANPADNVTANVTLNVLGNVAQNPIDEIFYENRGRFQNVNTTNGPTPAQLSRVQVYQAEYTWNHEMFDLKGFYRTGHYHWAYEGDFFNLYQEANYGPNIDIYNGLAPQGFEFEGKKELKDLKVAYGRELWWGANAAVLVKYGKHIGKYKVTGIFHEDLQAPGAAVSSIAIPTPKTRRVTLAASREIGKFGIEAGGIWGGQPLVGREFQIAQENSDGDYDVVVDKIRESDTWGGKMKLTFSSGRINWYAQSAYMGLVAMGGFDQTRTFTGWRLKDSGSGNQTNFLTGFTYSLGKWQIAPNFLWQKPLVDPMPGDVGGAGRLRNIIADPFMVGVNRETTAGELLITFDPTPGSWMYEWDNDRAEDAKFAASVGFVYRHLPTSTDANIIFPGTGRVAAAADGAAPALDLWEVNARLVSKLTPDFGIIANLYGGNGQARGSDPREIERYGGDVRVIYKTIKVVSHVRVNDWGPFDYHRDFNLTYPLQTMLDVSTSAGKQDWFVLPNTTLGMRFTWRSMDENSPRYSPNAAEEFATSPIISPVGFPNGNEWEFRTYVNISLGK